GLGEALAALLYRAFRGEFAEQPLQLDLVGALDPEGARDLALADLAGLAGLAHRLSLARQKGENVFARGRRRGAGSARLLLRQFRFRLARRRKSFGRAGRTIHARRPVRYAAAKGSDAMAKIKSITLCADDYALSYGVSAGILEALRAGRLSATSALTNGPRWPALGRDLARGEFDADVGLHLNLTLGH